MKHYSDCNCYLCKENPKLFVPPCIFCNNPINQICSNYSDELNTELFKSDCTPCKTKFVLLNHKIIAAQLNINVYYLTISFFDNSILISNDKYNTVTKEIFFKDHKHLLSIINTYRLFQ